MAIETLNVGTGPGTGDGDGLRSAQIKVNSNFAVSENAASKIVQASSADITADKVIMSDYAWRSAQLGDYFTYGGTANAITLTSANLKAGGTLIAGMKFRFKATAANTGATAIAVDGGSAIACVTPRGVALPAGFIRTDVITECEYDGSNFVVSRKVESGSNANGDWIKYETGEINFSNTIAITSDGDSDMRALYTFPVALSGIANSININITDSVGASTALTDADISYVRAGVPSSTGVTIVCYAAGTFTNGDSVECYVFGTGKWY